MYCTICIGANACRILLMSENLLNVQRRIKYKDNFHLIRKIQFCRKHSSCFLELYLYINFCTASLLNQISLFNISTVRRQFKRHNKSIMAYSICLFCCWLTLQFYHKQENASTYCNYVQNISRNQLAGKQWCCPKCSLCH